MSATQQPADGDYEYEIAGDDVREWILEETEDRVSEQDPWTSKGELRQQVVKTDHDVDDFKQTVRALIERDELFSWHGLLTLPRDSLLRAVIEAEADADVTRRRLVKKCNEWLDRGGS